MRFLTKVLDATFVLALGLITLGLFLVPTAPHTGPGLAGPATTQTAPEFSVKGIYRFAQEGSGGTCFAVAVTDRDFYVLTAAHCVMKDEDTLGDGFMVDGSPARLLAVDPLTDLALLAVPVENRDVRVYELAEAALYSKVVAVGYGVIDNRQHLLFMQGFVASTDLPRTVIANTGIQAGMSGGPLLNEAGQVVGVCSRAPMFGYSPNPSVGCFARPSAFVPDLFRSIELDKRRP